MYFTEITVQYLPRPFLVLPVGASVKKRPEWNLLRPHYQVFPLRSPSDVNVHPKAQRSKSENFTHFITNCHKREFSRSPAKYDFRYRHIFSTPAKISGITLDGRTPYCRCRRGAETGWDFPHHRALSDYAQ